MSGASIPTDLSAVAKTLATGIKSIQQVSNVIAGATTQVNVTISAINFAKSFLVPGNANAGNTTDAAANYQSVSFVLTSSTNVQVTRSGTAAAAGNIVYSFTVVEFY